jgi:RimJ/RimL family protein N-acetyltransferase
MMKGMDGDLTLRPLAEADLHILEKLETDPAATGEFAWLGWHNLARFWQLWADNGLISDDSGILLVVRGEDRLGIVSWRKVPSTPVYYYWNIGIALLPEARGKGYGTQAQRMLARYLFTHTTVQRIEAATEVGNVAEQRALEKAGFTREGVHRCVGWRDGAYRDGVWYSMVRTDQPG